MFKTVVSRCQSRVDTKWEGLDVLSRLGFSGTVCPANREVQSCCRFGQTWSTNVGRRNWAEQFFCVCQIVTQVAILVAGGFQNEKKPNHEMQVACISP